MNKKHFNNKITKLIYHKNKMKISMTKKNKNKNSLVKIK